MLDHIGFGVSDFSKSRAFYTAALDSLGIAPLFEGDTWAMFGRNRKGALWIGRHTSVATPIHLSFTAENREQVNRFYAGALSAGGRDNGAPGLRPNYHPNYFAAFVLDPDGHNVEAVCHAPESK